MIRYSSSGYGCAYLAGFGWLLKLRAFRRAFVLGCMAASLAVLVKYYDSETDFIIAVFDNSAYTSFTYFLGIMVVFRTSQSYSRFWGGCTSVHKMMGRWTDATVAVIAFSRASTAGEEKRSVLISTFIRLISILNALILAELEGSESPKTSRAAFSYQLLDPQAIDRDCLEALRRSPKKSLMVYQWIHSLMVDGNLNGVLGVPPPLLTRAFQAMDQGLLDYHDALKYADTPFPFPYTAAMELLLTVHFFLTPIAVCSWVDNYYLAFLFTFVLVSSVWVLQSVSAELENPFGSDLNDLDMDEMQGDMNNTLWALASQDFSRLPRVSTRFTSSQLMQRTRRTDSCTTNSCSFELLLISQRHKHSLLDKQLQNAARLHEEEEEEALGRRNEEEEEEQEKGRDEEGPVSRTSPSAAVMLGGLARDSILPTSVGPGEVCGTGAFTSQSSSTTLGSLHLHSQAEFAL